MTVEGWDPDQAELLPPADTEDSDTASVYRYGVTDWESSHPEPLGVALAQEVPEESGPADEVGETEDDEWADVDAETGFPGRLLADVEEGDDDYALAVADADDYAAEELAMHIVEE